MPLSLSLSLPPNFLEAASLPLSAFPNGAKPHEIIRMLNKEIAKWVLIAFIIACPVAWYAMHKWLENFAYKTELSWWIFAMAGFIALGYVSF